VLTALHHVQVPDCPGHRRLYVDDPVGNRLELLEPVDAG
jgi:hypothetical protein